MLKDEHKGGQHKMERIAIAWSEQNAERDKRILKRHGFKVRIKKVKSDFVWHGRVLKRTQYVVIGTKND